VVYKCQLAGLKPLSLEAVTGILKSVCKSESIAFDEEALRLLARSCGGDVRGALNDLQSLAGEKVTREQVLALGERERTESMIQTLIKIFKTKDPKLAREALNNVNEDVKEIVLWMDENIPREYVQPLDLSRAFDSLSWADRFLGRIRRWQHYRYYVYCYDLLSAGIALAKDEKYKELVQYKPTMRLLKIWQANQRNSMKKAIASKLAIETHTSSKDCLKNTLPYFLSACKQNQSFATKFSEFLDLDKEEMAWLGK